MGGEINGQTLLLSDFANSTVWSETQAPCQQPNQLKTFWNFSLHFRLFSLIQQFQLLYEDYTHYTYTKSLKIFLSAIKEP